MIRAMIWLFKGGRTSGKEEWREEEVNYRDKKTKKQTIATNFFYYLCNIKLGLARRVHLSHRVLQCTNGHHCSIASLLFMLSKKGRYLMPFFVCLKNRILMSVKKLKDNVPLSFENVLVFGPNSLVNDWSLLESFVFYGFSIPFSLICSF